MRSRPTVPGFLLAAVVVLGLAAGFPPEAGDQRAAYRALRLAPKDVLSGTLVGARVRPGGDRQTVVLATYFTGKRTERDAVDVCLAVLLSRDGTFDVAYRRDFGAEAGYPVGRGDLQLIDLDGDGVQEIVVSFDDLSDTLVRRRRGEVLVAEGAGYRVAWSGLLEYDATRAARDVPKERRDRYRRELDVRETLRTRGVTLIFSKTVDSIAGERLAEPKVARETFPLRPAHPEW